MLAIIETKVLAPLVVIQFDHLPFNGIVEVLFLDEDVRTQDNLVLLWYVSTLHEPITCFKSHMQLRLKCKLMRQ